MRDRGSSDLERAATAGTLPPLNLHRTDNLAGVKFVYGGSKVRVGEGGGEVRRAQTHTRSGKAAANSVEK